MMCTELCFPVIILLYCIFDNYDLFCKVAVIVITNTIYKKIYFPNNTTKNNENNNCLLKVKSHIFQTSYKIVFSDLQ